MVNPSTMRLGIASILVGLVGAWGVRTMMDDEEPVAEKAPPQAALVPLAATDLPEGRTIRRGDIGFVEMTQNEMIERGWQTNLVMTGVEDIVGRQLKKRIALHSPFLTTDLYLEDEGPRYRVRDGYRAAQVTVHPAHGGHVDEGATVDVYFTSDKKDGKRGEISIPKKTIKVVSAVPVLHVFRPQLNALQNAVGYKEKDPTFTLEVEPTIAENINVLTDHGRFSMVERPEGDVALPTESTEAPKGFLDLLGIEEPEPQYPPPTWVTEYYRGGSKGALQFPVNYAPPPQDPDQVAQGDNPPASGPNGAARGPQPTPAARPPAGAQPQIPYRPDAQPDEALPRPPEQTPTPATPTPAVDAPPQAADPFVDDPKVDDAESDEVFPR